MLDDLETTIKFIVVGNGHVGKSSMTTRYCKNIYTDTYKKTIGVDFMEKTIELDDFGEAVKLMIWDTAGQEEFDSLTSRYYKGAGAAVLVFSTDDRDSFDAIESWKRKVEDECGDIAMALVQNKIDLMDRAVMTSDEVEGLARKLGLRLYRACVKDNVNVSEVFEYLTTEYLMRGQDSGGGVADISEFVVQEESALSPSKASRHEAAASAPRSPSPTRSEDGDSMTSSPGPSDSPAPVASPRPRAAASGPASGGARAGAGGGSTRSGAPSGTFKLTVSKVRTGNKKRRLPCSIL